MKLQSDYRFLGFLGAIAFTVLLPTIAQAHPGHIEGAGGWVAGFSHPLNGWDHILAMVAVGLWAAQLGGPAVWTMPLVFVAVMAGSAAIGAMTGPLPWVEQGIILSDLILGGLVLAATRLPIRRGLLIVAILAGFHGYAHGAEMPQMASAFSYGTGFVMATALLHGIGLGLAFMLKNPMMVRLAGGAIGVGGGYMLLQGMIG
ncbi:MAG: HupE/UreJ family protein [Alkalinema sp. RU_4_3]|nr:HupE/UreJ family protein [Alkalinema sp. RU_4_3]